MATPTLMAIAQRCPDLLQEVWVPLHWNLAPNFWIHVEGVLPEPERVSAKRTTIQLYLSSTILVAPWQPLGYFVARQETG